MQQNLILPQGLLFSAVLAAVAAFPIFLFGRRSLGFKAGKASLFTVVTLLGSIGAFLYEMVQFMHLRNSGGEQWGNRNSESLLTVACSASILVLTGLPLLLKFYKVWICGEMTEHERAPGGVGLRAWFSPAKLCLAFLFSIAAANLFDCTFLETFGLTLLALGAYPLINTLNSANTSTSETHTTMNTEREKILAMVESNKITAEEGVELLNALGAGGQPWGSSARGSASRPQIRAVAIIGGALVLVGFFLPWFVINLNQAMQNIGGQIGNKFQSQGFPFGNAAQNLMGSIGASLPQVTVTVTGGDVPHGLGWAILLLGVAVALLPLLAAQIQADIQQRIELLALAIGACLLIYLAADDWRYINIGFILVAAGYLIQGANAIVRLGGFRAVGNLVQKPA